jgi:hypothetical protein
VDGGANCSCRSTASRYAKLVGPQNSVLRRSVVLRQLDYAARLRSYLHAKRGRYQSNWYDADYRKRLRSWLRGLCCCEASGGMISKPGKLLLTRAHHVARSDPWNQIQRHRIGCGSRAPSHASPRHRNFEPTVSAGSDLR